MKSRENQIYRVTIVGTVVNLLLTAIKFFAGIVGRSSAMVADAVHSLSDLVSDLVVLVFVRVAGKPEDSDHSFGHGKYETMGTIIIGLMLGAVGIGLLVEGVEKMVRFFNGVEIEKPNWLALGAALLSLGSKEWLYQYTVRAGRRIGSQVLIANAWHHRSDAITSVAALIGIAGAMLLGPGWRVLDPLAAAVVSIYIMVAAWKLIKPAADELLDKSLDPNQMEEIGSIIMSNPEVRGFHRLRTRRAGNRVVISCHIKIDGSMTLDAAHAIASDVEERLRKRFGPDTILSIHMEPAGADCRLRVP